MDRRANTTKGIAGLSLHVRLIIFIIKMIISPIPLFIFCFSFKPPMSLYELHRQSIYTHIHTRIKKKKNPCNYIATATYPNVCVHAYGCIRAFCVAVLGACSASSSAHGSCIIASNYATAMGILWQCSLRAEVFEYLCRGCNPDLILSSSVLARANRR